jgi:hypothetical protein
MTSLREKLEWLGGAAIVLSLLLVALEIRQNTNALAAQAVFELNDASNEKLMALATDPEMSRLVALGDADPDSLSDEEEFRYRRYVLVWLNQFESVWFFDQRGVVSEEEIESWRRSFCSFTAIEGHRRFILEISEMTSSVNRISAGWCTAEE